MSLEEKFSQLNFTIRSQLDKSINLTDPTMKNRADRRFEKGLRNSSRTSHARASTTCIRCQVSATFAESNRIPARVSSRAPNSGRKTEGEEEEEEEASPGNKRRDKWRIDATVIYVDPLPPHPSSKKGRRGRVGAVSTPAFPTLIVSENPPQAAHRHDCSLFPSSLSLLLSLRMHGEDLNFNESRGSSICFLG